MIAISKRYTSALAEISHGRYLEQICVACTVQGMQLFICAIYIPPDKSRLVDVMETHVASIRELCDLQQDDGAVLVCGDYNQPRLKWLRKEEETVVSESQITPSSSALIDGMNFLNMHQYNSITNQLGRTLDLVFGSDNLRLTVDESVTPLLRVDNHHPPLVISIPTAECTPLRNSTSNHRSHMLNYRRIDFDALQSFLEGFDWDSRLNNLEIDDMTTVFCNVITEWLDTNVPSKRKPVSPAWSTPLLRDLRRKKNSCQRKLRCNRNYANKRNFNIASQAYRKLNSTLYRSYVQRIQFSLRSNPREF